MSVTEGGLHQFPDINIPDSAKTEEWHKKFVYAIADRSLNGGFDLDYRSVEECQNYYNGVQDSKAFEFLQFADDGDRLPAFWVNYNKIRPKVDLLIGEYSKKGYRIGVSSIDSGAKVKKLEKREDARVEHRLAPYAAQLEGEFGMPLQQGKQFDDEEELDDFFSYTYKEKSEVVMKNALEYALARQRWDYERKALFRDLIITNRCFAKCELINGIPKTRRIDPKFMIFDRDATDDYLTDSTYIGEVRYMNIAEAAQKYKVTKKQLKQSYNSQKYINKSSDPIRYKGINDLISNSSLSFFNDDAGELRVLVIEAYWSDYKPLNYKNSTDKHGNTHIKVITDDTKTSKNIDSNYYKIWRKGVLLGGEFLVEYGEVKNMPRSVDDPADTGCPYKCLIPGYLNYSSSSIVSRLQPLQDLKNIAMYNMQLAMTRAGAKGFIYDTAQLPEGWDVENVTKYLKTAGIALINSRQDDGLPPAYNQFQRIDLSLGDEVNRYIEISLTMDREMDNITGINEARQGIVQNSSQAVGVTQSALMQSSLTTEEYFDSMRIFMNDAFNYMGGLIKIAWPEYSDAFAPIIGDDGINFLMTDVDLDLEDYSIEIEEIPVSLADTQNLHSIVQAAIQSGQIDIVPALKILKETDIDRGIRMLERETNKKKREMEKAQAQQQQAEAQAQQQQAEAQSQLEQQKAQGDFQSKAALEEIKGSNKLEQISAEGRLDLIGDALKKKEIQ